jgi:hypothetical protein
MGARNITQQQIESIILDAAIVFKNYGLSSQEEIGITRDGAEFNVTEEIRQIEHDRSMGRTKGFETVDKIDAYIKVKTLELTNEHIRDSLAACMVTENGGIVNTTGGIIPDDRYLDNVTIFGIENKSGAYKKIQIRNAAACNNGGLTTSFSPKGEAELDLQFNAAWNPLDVTEKLYSIDDVNDAPVSVLLRALEVVCTAGTSGKTVVHIIGSARSDMGFVYKATASEPSAPDAGDTITGGTAIISGTEISTTNNYYVAVYEIKANGECWGYGVTKAVVE